MVPLDDDTVVRQKAFLSQFKHLWPGGYLEGDPLDPLSPSSYGVVGFNSVLYTTYLACIRPYVDATTTAIEVGPGRGAWSRAILKHRPQRLYAVDVVSADRTGFWAHVGDSDAVTYLTASDFSLAGVPDASSTYFFSFGVFCHLRPEHCTEYLASLHRKLVVGANCFLMIADFDKFNRCIRNIDSFRGRLGLRTAPSPWPYLDKDDTNPLASADGLGRWYHFGVNDACRCLERLGFTVIEADICVNPRDPVIHFRR